MSPPPDLAYQYSPEELEALHHPRHHSRGDPEHPPGDPHEKHERSPERGRKQTPITVLEAEPGPWPDLHLDEMIREARGDSKAETEQEDELIRLIIDVKALKEAEASAQTDGKKKKLPLKRRHPALHRFLKTLMILGIVLVSLIVVAVLWLLYQIDRGKRQMIVNYDTAIIELPTDRVEAQTDDYGHTVRYNGHTYALNQNLTTILFMGIDREELDGVEVVGTGGQADVLLLISEDTETGKARILNIPRDTCAEFMQYSRSGYQVGYTESQICLAYAYGDGREMSCDNTLKAVSALLYGMPISKYIAMDIAGVSAANDAVGGVTVTFLDDVRMTDGSVIEAGNTRTLHGDEAVRYVRSREHDLEGNSRRNERQKQYVSAFVQAAVRQAKSDWSSLSRVYGVIDPYIVSNLELSDLLFLANVYMGCGAEFEFQNLTGELTWTDNQYGKDVAVLYPDEERLFETVLDIYYTQVD